MMMRENIIPLFKVFMSDKAPKTVSEVLMSGFIGQGSKVDEFESLLKEFFHTPNVVTTNAATSAEHIALHMLKRPERNVKGYHGVAFVENQWDGIGSTIPALVHFCFLAMQTLLELIG